MIDHKDVARAPTMNDQLSSVLHRSFDVIDDEDSLSARNAFEPEAQLRLDRRFDFRTITGG